MKKILGLGLVALLGVVLTACGNGSSSSSKSENSSSGVASSSSKKVENKYFFKNDELVIHDLKIKITKTKVIAVGDVGNEYGTKPVIAIWYNTTNLTSKEIDPNIAWMAVFEAYQDTSKTQVNKLDVASLPDETFLDTQTENIKENATAPNAVAYELDSTTVPVKLVATQGVGGDKLGTKTIDLQ